MRIALLADIHANLAALRAVLDHAEVRRPVDRLWVLGDTVGYGPLPNECVALLRRYPHDAVMGNHDLAALGRMDTAWFNELAATATEWTATRLSDESRRYLAGLPETSRPLEDWTLAHGTLRDPITEYLYSPAAAAAHFERQRTPMAAVGHTHVPALARLPLGAERARFETLGAGAVLPVERDCACVVNPGGVGQPRDGDPRAAYALLDTNAEEITFHRVEYDISATQRAMAEAGLPQPLIDRLNHGR